MTEEEKQSIGLLQDIFNRAVTYYTFHIGLNYLVLGWLLTGPPNASHGHMALLAGVFIFHNASALVSYGAVVWYLSKNTFKKIDGVPVPPYRLAAVMMCITLVFMTILWGCAPCIFSK